MMPGEREHPGLFPPPWRWSDERGDAMLVAADHVTPTEDNDYEGHDSIVLSERIMCLPSEMSPYVRETVRAAAEMEALLRHVHQELVDMLSDTANEVGALLARIDAATKGGG